VKFQKSTSISRLWYLFLFGIIVNFLFMFFLGWDTKFFIFSAFIFLFAWFDEWREASVIINEDGISKWSWTSRKEYKWQDVSDVREGNKEFVFCLKNGKIIVHFFYFKDEWEALEIFICSKNPCK